MNIWDNEKPTFGTTIFYDLYKKDALGHKIIVTLKCGSFEINPTLDFLKKKAKDIMVKYPHFRCRMIDYEWMYFRIDYDKMVVFVDKPHSLVADDILNTPFDTTMPGWNVTITNDNHIIFSCDHTYGDGAYIANVIKEIFDDDSFNNILLSKSKTKSYFRFNPFELFSRVTLFFRIIYLIYVRFISMYIFSFFFVMNDVVQEERQAVQQTKIAELSLSELKKIQTLYSVKNSGKHFSINDILHSILVKTNHDYLKKGTITSAAMFNMRNDITDIHKENKWGCILLANDVKENVFPEHILSEVHEFMEFYKKTPATWLISKAIHLYYDWDNEKACHLLRFLNKKVDFVISNYVLPYKEKVFSDGIVIENAYNIVTPCDVSQLYSILTYGDKVNIHLTYKRDTVTDIERLKMCFENSLKWMRR